MFKVGDIIQNDWPEGGRFRVVGEGDVVVIGVIVESAIIIPGNGAVCADVIQSDAIGTIVAIEEHDSRQFYKVFYHTGRYDGWPDFYDEKPTSGFFTAETAAKMKRFN